MGIRRTAGGGGGGGVDLLSERAAMMREAVQQSQSITDNMVSILGSFDHRLSALETAMRPTQVSFLFFGFLDLAHQLAVEMHCIPGFGFLLGF